MIFDKEPLFNDEKKAQVFFYYACIIKKIKLGLHLTIQRKTKTFKT